MTDVVVWMFPLSGRLKHDRDDLIQTREARLRLALSSLSDILRLEEVLSLLCYLRGVWDGDGCIERYLEPRCAGGLLWSIIDDLYGGDTPMMVVEESSENESLSRVIKSP